MLIATRGGGLKSRAFTLIELLAVIIIIGVIALIATPVIIGVIGKTERGAFERSIDGLLETVRLDYSSDDFVSPREYYYEGKDLILLTVNDKVKDESVGIIGRIDGRGFLYVDEDGMIHIENICSKEYCANGKGNEIKITENESGVIPEISKNDPIIKLKGESIIYINLNGTYEEPGIVAKTKAGKALEYTREIRVNGEEVSEIETREANTYEIEYKTENEGKEVSVIRTVIVVDMEPVITMTEGSTKYVKEQEVLVTVSAVKPNKIENFTVEIKKNSEVISIEIVTGISKTFTLNETGEYEVIVTVTDNNNHTNTETRIYKIDTVSPEIEFRQAVLSMKANEVSGFNLTEDETVVVTDNSEIVTWEVEGELNTTVGEQKVTYIARDEAGNETRKERTFEITDSDGPVINYSSASSNNIWIGAQEPPITIYARIEVENDELTSFSYQVDSGTEVSVPITNNQQMDTQVILNTTGKHSIKIKAVGKYGNETSETIGEFWIDGDKPTAPTTMNFVYGDFIAVPNNSWTNTNLYAARTKDNQSPTGSTDVGSGVAKYQISQDNKTWVDYKYAYSAEETVYAIHEEGVHTRYFRAVDYAGNVSEPLAITAKIDKTAPTAPTTMNFVFGDWSVYTNNTWTYNNVYAGRTQNSPGPTGATDARSGIDKYQISTDNKTWVDFSYTNSGIYKMDTEGTHTRYFRAVDNAGNVSPSISRVAKIDKTGPTVGNISMNTTTSSTSKTLTATITDSGSGVKSYAIIIGSATKPAANSSVWNTISTATSSYNFSTTVSSNETYYLWAKDEAGNISSVAKSVTITSIDNGKPSLLNLYARGYIGGNEITGTFIDRGGLSGYVISSAAANSCSGTAPTTWTAISGTTYDMSINFTGYGNTYIWIKDVAGNKSCFTKKIYKVHYNAGGTSVCVNTTASFKDSGGYLTGSITTTCNSVDHSKRAYLTLYTSGASTVTYTLASIDLPTYVELWNNSKSGEAGTKITQLGTYTNQNNGNMHYTSGVQGTKTVYEKYSKIVADSVVIYDGTFQTY